MEYRQLGRSGLRVSVLALGTMTFGGKGIYAHAGAAGVEEARRLIDIAVDGGVNLLDTANGYSDGLSEEILGKAIRGRRGHLLIATKARMPVGEGPNDSGLSRHHLIEQVDGSLRRLGVEHIDLFQLHNWDGLTPVEETLHALDTLIGSGKVRYVGCSNFSGWQLMKALSASERHHYQRFIAQQIHYTLQAREAEYELVPIAIDQGVGILVWSPLAGGLLTGKYRRDLPEPEGARHTVGWMEPPVPDRGKLYDIVDVLVEIGAAHDASPAQVALSWLLGRQGVTSAVIGARSQEQLCDSLLSVDLHLASEERLRLDAVSAPPLIYPYWHHAKSANDRLGSVDLALLDPYLRR